MAHATEHAVGGRKPFLTPWTGILVVLAAIGVVLMAVRFVKGIGSVSNLNDAYPWGFWIGFDVLAGIALAAGGFTLTAAVYVWQNRKYQVVIRPAILTAFLGYVIFVLALMVDLGRYYKIWHVLWPAYWQNDSVMFEVSWCVTCYLLVLLFEFVPIVFERFKLERLMSMWRNLMPAVIILLLTVFTLALAHERWWVLVVAGLMAVFELLRAAKLIRPHHGPPILLIMAGVVLSCLHQSSLGSLYLIVPHKLHPLWYTPVLPILFVVSAIAVGPAMVILESLISGRIFRHELKTEVLTGIGRAIPVILSVLLIIRIGDVVARGAFWYAFEPTVTSLMFWIEIVIGCAIPITLLGTPEANRSRKGLFLGALCVVIGLIVHRFNVSMVGISALGWQTYVPAVAEVLISVGVISLGLLVYRFIVLNFPIFEEQRKEPVAVAE